MVSNIPPNGMVHVYMKFGDEVVSDQQKAGIANVVGGTTVLFSYRVIAQFRVCAHLLYEELVGEGSGDVRTEGSKSVGVE